jgi:hypothetical protein
LRPSTPESIVAALWLTVGLARCVIDIEVSLPKTQAENLIAISLRFV